MVKFKPYFERHYPRIERIIAIIALINLGLVFFDLSYLNLRQAYRQYLPSITQLYDPVKGIEAHPETEYYQSRVEQLEAQISQGSLQPPQLESSLSELRILSQRLITETSFWGNGEHTLATVQQNLRLRTGETFASDAFNQFWSTAYLEQRGWQQELSFWNSQISPFLRANYYRRANRFGITVDYFWLVDLPFVLVFAADILMRIIAMHRHNPDLTWLDVVLRRWYDAFLLLPFWRWLRIIPVMLRLYQADLLDLEPVRAEAQRDTIIAVGADLAGIVGIEIIEQMQDSIRQGDLLSWLPSESLPQQDSSSHDFVPGSSTRIVLQDEVMAIANHLYEVGVHHILPRIQPDVEDLVQHSLANTLEQMPGYPQLNHLPGLERVSAQVVQKISNSVVQGIYGSMTGPFLDAEGQEIASRLQRHLQDAIAEEFNQHNTTQEIQTRLVDVLEKFKYKYVKALAEAGGEKLAERTELLRRQIS